MQNGPNIGGPSMTSVCNIAKLHITDVDGNIPLDFCYHCKRFIYEEIEENEKDSDSD